VRADDDGDLRVGAFEIGELLFEGVGGGLDFVEFDDVVAIDRNDLDVGGIDFGLRGRAGGHDEVEAVLDEGRREHEDDEEDEGEVEQGRHVELGDGTEVASVGVAAHCGGSAGDAAPLAGAVFDVAVLDFGGEFGGEVIGADDD